MKRFGLIALLAMVWIGRAANATAEDKSGAVMVKVSPTTRDADVAKRVAAQALAAAGWDVKDVKFSDKDTAAVTACMRASNEGKCMNTLLRAKKLTRIAVYSLVTEERTKELVVTGEMVVSDVAAIPNKQRFCEQCTDDTLAEHVKVITTRMLDEIALQSGRIVLDVTSVPVGAAVALDGNPVGFTDLKMPITPGPHRVMVSHPGFVTVEQEVVGVDGVTARVAATMVPGSGTQRVATVAPAATAGTAPVATASVVPQVAERSVDRGRASRVGPYALMTVGGVAVIAGGVLIAMNEPDIASPPTQEQPHYRQATLLPGALTAAGGVGALVVGYFWNRSISSRAQPVVSASGSGVALGLAGTF